MEVAYIMAANSESQNSCFVGMCQWKELPGLWAYKLRTPLELEWIVVAELSACFSRESFSSNQYFSCFIEKFSRNHAFYLGSEVKKKIVLLQSVFVVRGHSIDHVKGFPPLHLSTRSSLSTSEPHWTIDFAPRQPGLLAHTSCRIAWLGNQYWVKIGCMIPSPTEKKKMKG